MSHPCLLIGDIGGTNARFAVADESRPGYSQPKTLQCADFANANSAIAEYLGSIGEDSPAAICIAAAGPVINDTVRFTNNHWVLDRAELQRNFETRQVSLLNDFEAVARSLPLLRNDDCVVIGKPDIQDLAGRDFMIAAVGAGTGLGAAGLKRRGGVDVPIIGETGNTSFSPQTDLQSEVQALLRRRDGHVPIEHLVSGPGIENLYAALARIHDTGVAKRSAAEIFSLGLDHSEPLAVESVNLFFQMLGQVAGDVALTLGAWNGIYIAGGIAARYPDALTGSRFRDGFEDKGDYRELMERIPTVLVTLPEPGLLGASDCARRLAGDTSKN